MISELSLKDLLIRFFFVILCCFMINRLFFFSPGIAEVTSSYLLYPWLRLQKVVADPLQKYWAQKSDVAVLQQQVADLEQHNEDLQAQMIALQTTIDFENRSQDARQFAQKYDVATKKLVQVLMKSCDEAGHFYWVDAGAQQNVTMNMIAVFKNNIVGRVIHVDQYYSKIALITDKRCKIAVSCAQTKTVGIYEGNNSWYPTLEFVPHYEPLLQDDILISTGQGLVYPQGFAVGKIIDFSIQDVAYRVTVKPLIDLQQLEFVYLVATA